MLKRIASFSPVSFTLETGNTCAQLGVARSAAALAYFLILSVFPLLVCINFLIGLLHLNLEELLHSLDYLLPAAALDTMADYLSYVASNQSNGLLFASVSAIVLSASAGLRTLLQTMDELFHTRDVNAFRRVAVSLFLSVLFLLTIYLSIVVIFTGDWFFRWLESVLPQRIAAIIPALSRLWDWLRYLLLFCVVMALVLVIYHLGIPKQVARRRLVFFCAVLTSLAMVSCSVLFSWFIGMSSRYDMLYGSLASMIIMLVWIYFCGNILLIGAVICRVMTTRRLRKDK